EEGVADVRSPLLVVDGQAAVPAILEGSRDERLDGEGVADAIDLHPIAVADGIVGAGADGDDLAQGAGPGADGSRGIGGAGGYAAVRRHHGNGEFDGNQANVV